MSVPVPSTPTNPADLLRQAAEHASKVLPGTLGTVAAAWLFAEAGCQEAIPEVGETVVGMLDSIGAAPASPSRFQVQISTLDQAVAFARAVLAMPAQAPVLEGLDAAEARGRAEALSKAADAWQRGAWANTPRHRDQVADRVGQAQYVTEWLRERAATTAPSEGDHHA